MDLKNLRLAPGLMPAIRNLMDLAEDVFGPKKGAAKKAWVIDALLSLADKVDVPLLPADLEHEIKRALIGVLVEALWGAMFQPARLRSSQVVTLQA